MNQVRLPPICILAGGLGTRLGEAARDVPKALVEVAGQPFIYHQLRLLAEHGAYNVVLCVGHLGEQIEQRVGSECFGIHITYSHDGPQPIGTLAAIRRAADRLGDGFLVLYGDTYLRVDYAAAAATWMRSGKPAMMTVLRNDGRWDASNASFDGKAVTAYDKRSPKPSMRWIDYGLGGLKRAALDKISDRYTDVCDLYHHLAQRGELCGFEASERFYEIGTPIALDEANTFLAATGGLAHGAHE